MGIQSAYSIVAASRNETRENGPIDLCADRVAWAADFLFGGAALSFGSADLGMAGFEVAALFRGDRTRGSADCGRCGGNLWGVDGGERAHVHRDWLVHPFSFSNVETRWSARSFAALRVSGNGKTSLKQGPSPAARGRASTSPHRERGRAGILRFALNDTGTE